MAKFHISPDGVPRACTAQAGSCKYGNDVPHFSTAEDARTAYEASQSGSFETATLTKKAAQHENTFTFQDATLDSKVWTYNDGTEGMWASDPTVTITADGYHYLPSRNGGRWSAEILKEDGDSWTSVKGTKSFDNFRELANHIENRAVKRYQAMAKDLEITHAEALTHLRNEKHRYDKIDEDENGAKSQVSLELTDENSQLAFDQMNDENEVSKRNMFAEYAHSLDMIKDANSTSEDNHFIVTVHKIELENQPVFVTFADELGDGGVPPADLEGYMKLSDNAITAQIYADEMVQDWERDMGFI